MRKMNSADGAVLEDDFMKVLKEKSENANLSPESSEVLINMESLDDSGIAECLQESYTVEEKYSKHSINSKIPVRHEADSQEAVPPDHRVSRSGSLQREVLLKKSKEKPKTPNELPHPLGSLPKYLQNPKQRTKTAPKSEFKPSTGARLLATASPLSTKTVGDSEHARKYLESLKVKAFEAQRENSELKLINQQLERKLEEAEKKVAEKDQQLNEKISKMKSMELNMKKLQSDFKKCSGDDAIAKMRSSELQVSELKKANGDLSKKVAKRDTDIHHMKIKLDKHTKSFENLSRDKVEPNNPLSSHIESDRAVKDVEIEITEKPNDSKEQQDYLKDGIECVNSKSTIKLSRKASITESGLLEHEVETLSDNENRLRLKVQTLKLKIDQDQEKMHRFEKLLQLRTEYINTLQDADELNKARLIVQLQEIEGLQNKVYGSKESGSTAQDVDDIRNQLALQEMEIQNLQETVESKEAKVRKYKKKLRECLGMI